MSVHVRDIAGERVAFLLADVPEDAPPVVREGIARRAVTAASGSCPCGAVFVLPSRAVRRRAARARQPIHVPITHADDCPAALLDAISRWRR